MTVQVQPTQSPAQPTQTAQPTKPTKTAQVQTKNWIVYPPMAVDTARWVSQNSVGSWSAVNAAMSLVILVIGFIMLLGDGITTIQAVRYMVWKAGFPMNNVELFSFPPLAWWTLPILMTILEIFTKHIGRLKNIWRTTIWLDGTTTSLFIAMGIINIFHSFGFFVEMSFHSRELWMIVGVAGVLGLGLAVSAEVLFLTGILMAITSFTKKRF
jgi:hypothetical protein